MRQLEPMPSNLFSRLFSGLLPGLLSGLLVCLGSAAPSLPAQPGDHAYRVHIGKAGWVTPVDASAKGYFFYKDRWLPKKLKSKLARWARLDTKVKSWKNAYRIKSKHYRIKTNAPHYIAELEFKPFLDELYRTYVSVFKNDFGLRGRAADKNHIHIYWGFPTWLANEKSDRGNPGYYELGGALKVMCDPTDLDDFYNTVFHEGAHQFFMAMLPGAELPIWLSEALAVYFEGCTFSRSTLKITENYLPTDRFESAVEDILAARKADRPVTPQALFMTVPDQQFDAGHYALAWSFLYFLIHREGGKHKSDVYKFLQEMNGSGAKSVHRVYKEATKKDLGEIEKAWAPYILALRVPPRSRRQVLTPKHASPDEDVHPDDLLQSIDGRRIDTEAGWEKHWVNRDKSRPVKLLLIRRYDKSGPTNYRQKFVTVVVKPDSLLELAANATVAWVRNLID